MSIVPLVRVTVCGLLDEKAGVLDELQTLGCLHLVPLGAGEREAQEPTQDAREALSFLLSCRERRRQVHDPAGFDAFAVQEAALGVQRRMRGLEDERDALENRIERVRPWGEFELPPASELGGLGLWFFRVPHYRLREIERIDEPWAIVRRDNRFAYVVVIAPNLPSDLPLAPEELDPRPLSALERRLDEVLIELEELQARRVALTRWCELLARDLHRLEDRAEHGRALGQCLDDPPLFALQGWAPMDARSELEARAAARGLTLVVEEPRAGETPPTLMRNPEPVAAGQDLVSFYSTPGYWNWDPSAAVFASFVLFFAMILSDAGYALAFGLAVALFWRRLEGSAARRRLRRLFLAMTGAAFVWGLLAGSVFGLVPPEGSVLGTLDVIDLDDHRAMMRLSILIGIAHVLAGNLGRAWHRRGEPGALAPVGWATMILGGGALWLAADLDAPGLRAAGPWLLAGGALLVLLFSSAAATPGRRLLGGLLALARIPSAFGDVLSYLRLFALGLASASLALVFNDLARQVAAALPGLGLLLAILIVVLGHAMNFALAVVGGFVHGLRLNFIEFFNWSLEGEGTPFRPFARKEASWTRS